MKKIFISTLLLFYFISFAQINVNIQLMKEKSKMLITVINPTNDFYALPFDKKGFKGYNYEEICSNINSLDYPHRFFAPLLIFKDSDKNSIVESLIGNFHIDRLSKKNTKKVKKEELREKRRILKWKEENHFTNDTDAIRNLYVYENLLLLKPKEKLSIEIEMDVYNIRRGNTYFYNYYTLTKGKQYNLSINLCADKTIYDYLTEAQKKYLERYNFFTGNIVSNTIPYIFKN